MTVVEVADRLEIENLFSAYCRAVDSKDWALYRSLLTDDAHLDYSAAGLFVGGPDDAVAYLTRHQEAISVGMHYVTNVASRIAGDTADVVAMWFNAVALPGTDGITFFHGRWHDTLVRGADGWRIREVKLEVVG